MPRARPHEIHEGDPVIADATSNQALDHPRGETKPLALIVDDSPDVHRLLRTKLNQEDLEFVGAESGEEGIATAVDRRPSVILLDVNMPGIDGFEILRRLKDDPRTSAIPVLMLSGHCDQDAKIRAFDLGAVDYVTKPFDFTELRVRMRSAVKMHMLIQLLAQRAQIDGLTGCWNRAFFDQRWAEETSRAQRHGHALSMAMLDIDHFKTINDTYGHPVGDDVLQGVAKILQRECRSSDFACRYGGEEFVLVMPATRPEDAAMVCERIRAATEATVWPRHPERRLTISIGVAGAAAPVALSAAEWHEAADRCLYRAKRTGRNRVVTIDLLADSTPRLRVAG